MNTVDQTLIELYNFGLEKLSKDIPGRDRKILSSLARQIISGHFLTENQGKLLVKILKENYGYIKNSVEDFFEVLEVPTWSKHFRVLEQYRKIYPIKGDNSAIIIEFSYNKRIRQKITDLNKLLEGQIYSISSKQYGVALTEKNIYTIVNEFKNTGFEIDQHLLKLYDEISEILEKKEPTFDVFNLKNEKLISAITVDIGKISEDNLLLLNDRKFKYQYQIFPKIPENSLTVSIAQRSSPKIWIDSTKVEFDEIIESLKALNRFPLLVVFNAHDSAESLENLKKLANSLKKFNVDESSGIYFRFDNSTDLNKEFNSYISTIQYNKNLNLTSQVAGIGNNKLPKFMISSDWKARSVISFSNNFKNNKTSLYCDDIDLVIFYNKLKPFGDINVIV